MVSNKKIDNIINKLNLIIEEQKQFLKALKNSKNLEKKTKINQKN